MSYLDPFLDCDVIALDDVAYVLRTEDAGFDASLTLPALVELGTRLPSGLVHAASIWILPEPPPGVAPLAAESPWYAIDQSLAVVVPALRSRVAALLTELARYHAMCARVQRELADRQDLLDALLAPELPPAAVAELSLLLDAPPNLVASLDRYAEGLRADLAAMATREFQPLVRLHAELRTKGQKQRGSRIAEALLSRLPHGPFRLLVSDGTMVLEHLSPYVRDLGHALTAWGLENAERLRTQGLVDALSSSRARPSADLAALVVPELLELEPERGPELIGERRDAESRSGLYLHDERGLAYGFAELARLALPDELSIAKDAHGTLALIAGAPEAALAEATRALLETGRVIGFACVLSSAIDVENAIVPDALASEVDGARLALAAELADRAVKCGVEVHRPGCVAISDAEAAPRIAMELVALARRAKVVGRLDEEAPISLVLYPRQNAVRATLTRGLSELFSGRLALYLLSSREDPVGAGKSRKGTSQNAPGISRRFRA